MKLNTQKWNFRYQISKFIFKKYVWFTETIHTRVQPAFIHNAKILSKKSCYATVGKPNKTFVAFSDNKLTLLIRTIKTLLEQ